MTFRSLAAVVAVAALTASLFGCASEPTGTPGEDVIAPVTMSVNELQGETVDLVVGQSLNINTDSLNVDSYTGVVTDAKIAEFVPGRIDDTAEFNPGVTALTEGETDVTMTNEQGGIQPLTFTVNVTSAAE